MLLYSIKDNLQTHLLNCHRNEAEKFKDSDVQFASSDELIIRHSRSQQSTSSKAGENAITNIRNFWELLMGVFCQQFETRHSTKMVKCVIGIKKWNRSVRVVGCMNCESHMFSLTHIFLKYLWRLLSCLHSVRASFADGAGITTQF